MSLSRPSTSTRTRWWRSKRTDRKTSSTGLQTLPESSATGKPRLDQGVTYAAFVSAQVENEHKRRDAIDSRAARILTTSGVLITVTATLGVWSTATSRELDASGVLGTGAVLAFVIAAGLGLWAGRGNGYDVVSEKAIKEWLRDRWRDTEASARSRIAQYELLTMASLRKGNGRRYTQTDVATGIQLLGLVLLGVAVGIALFHGPGGHLPTRS